MYAAPTITDDDAPPDAGTTWMRAFLTLKSAEAEKAIGRPSGDHVGPAAAPSRVTRFRTSPVATVTTDLSAVWPSGRLGSPVRSAR